MRQARWRRTRQGIAATEQGVRAPFLAILLTLASGCASKPPPTQAEAPPAPCDQRATKVVAWASVCREDAALHGDGERGACATASLREARKLAEVVHATHGEQTPSLAQMGLMAEARLATLEGVLTHCGCEVQLPVAQGSVSSTVVSAPMPDIEPSVGATPQISAMPGR